MVKILEKKGNVFKVKRFSVHDGPGIRTTVFLKGCPLNCIWCHSPEGISSEISIWYNRNVCIFCGQCVQVCPNKALELIKNEDSFIKINRESCKVSGECVKICPTNALQFTGSTSSVSQIVKEIEKDIAFYEMSGGGVTLSGGEPLYQPDFSAEILKTCKKRNIHTAIETSLLCERESLDLVLEYIDLFIIDIKFVDSVKHKYYTGKTNKTILDNFRYISKSEKPILVRIPLIHNITDNEDNKNAIIDFVHEINNKIPIEFINYNPLAENNYKRLGIPFFL